MAVFGMVEIRAWLTISNIGKERNLAAFGACRTVSHRAQSHHRIPRTYGARNAV
jgi:hypothetical protein